MENIVGVIQCRKIFALVIVLIVSNKAGQRKDQQDKRREYGILEPRSQKVIDVMKPQPHPDGKRNIAREQIRG